MPPVVTLRLGRPVFWAAAFAALAAGGQEAHVVPFFPAAPATTETAGAAPRPQGFLRLINHSAVNGQVRIAGFDDGGRRSTPVTLELAAGAVAHFNSHDFQNGNPSKGLAAGAGPPGDGDWWLELTSALDVEVHAYIRGVDGFLTSMHDAAPESGGLHRIAFFNPGSNTRQQSRLRLVNPGDAPVDVTIRAVDDNGRNAGPVRATVPARAAYTFTAQQLEAGAAALGGSLEDGAGKWRLTVAASGPLRALSLLANPTGHIANLSTTPTAGHDSAIHHVPLFPAAAHTNQGFLRVINRGAAGAARIVAFDDTGAARAPIRLTIGAGRTAHFNSTDLERGNPAKGLSGGVGVGVGEWRLEVRSASASEARDGTAELQVLAYVRSPEGFVSSMHDIAPVTGAAHRVPTFNPGSNTTRQSLLRVVNLGAAPATAVVAGVGDDSVEGRRVVFGVPAEGARTVSASALEVGGDGIVGALGAGIGKWRLAVTANQPIAVMSLLRGSSGPMTNLSTTLYVPAPPRDDPSPIRTVAPLDSIPNSGVDIRPGARHINIVHRAEPQDAYAYSGACSTGVAVRRELPHRADQPQREVVDHKIECDLAPLSMHRVQAAGLHREHPGVGSELSFTTGRAPDDAPISVLGTRTIARDQVNDMLDSYIEDALIADIESDWAKLLVAIAIDELARRTWAELRNPDARYDVVTQRVSYASRTPTGAPSNAVTGLVALPDVRAAPDFVRKSRVVVLSHATGSTPSKLDDGDAWYALAVMFAGRGYLTIVPDNWGRGELKTPGQPETYLMGNRSANNSVDLLQAVLASDEYRAFHDTDAERTPISIVGYSQGAHTALALWLALHTGEHGMTVRELFAGGGPHNLLETFRGAMQHLAHTCDDGNKWCRYVDNDVVLPYIVGRILPALMAYTDIGLASADVMEGDNLRTDFATGFLAGDAEYEALHTFLALNSFTNIVAPASAIRGGTEINLYHSKHDRLVPQANTRDLAKLLAPAFGARHHKDECGNDAYKDIFELTDRVGVLHLLCGMEVMDDVLKRFR